MDVYNRWQGETEWRGPFEPMTGIAHCLDGEPELLLAVEWPILESATLTAAVRLARTVWADRVTIGIATPYPSPEALSAAFAAGADYVMVGRTVQSNGSGRSGLEAVCPGLLQRIKNNVPMALCGESKGRMVLSAHNIARWCLDGGADCPFRSALE